MIQLNSVLVAFDFSETSKSALTYGTNIARAFGGRLHVLHVADVIATSAAQFYPEGPGDPEAKAIELGTKQLRTALAAAQIPVGSAFGRTIDAVPEVRVSRSPSQVICEYAKEVHADLIIVGTHGRSGVSRFLMGSVAEHVVRTAPCPVLVVRPNEHEFVLPDPVGVLARA
jgi:nucleotide-binding universal stress UspA family protein